MEQLQHQLQTKEQQLQLKQQQFDFEQQKQLFQQYNQQHIYQQPQLRPHLPQLSSPIPQHKQQRQQQHHQHEQFYNIDEFVSLPLLTMSSPSSSQLPTTTSTTNMALIELPLQQQEQQQPQHQSITTTSVQGENNPIVDNELLQHVIQDYQSMKYLVEQSTTTQQLFQQHYATLNEKLKDVDDIKQIQLKMNKIDEIESQLLLSTKTLQQSLQQSLQNQSKRFGQRLILLEQSSQKQLPTPQMIENQRKQVPLILKQNRKLNDKYYYPFIIIQIENCPSIQASCYYLSYDKPIYQVFYTNLISNIHPTTLEPLQRTIEKSKLYISSQSVLNGEWIQIQGNGKIVDMKEVQLGDFLKPGDDIYSVEDYPCIDCELDEDEDRDQDEDEDEDEFKYTTTNRFLIKFKWV